MTLEQRLKDIESINHVSKSDHVDLLIQALRKAIEQRDDWMYAACEFKRSNGILDDLIKLANENKELLEILEGK